MEYPNNLRRLRDARKLTQADVAEALGINQAEYSRIEKGRQRVGTRLKNSLKSSVSRTTSSHRISTPAPLTTTHVYSTLCLKWTVKASVLIWL